MRRLPIVVSDVHPQGPLKVTFAQDEDMVQTLSSYGSDETFSDGVRFWRARRCADDPHSFRAKHLVERPPVLGVAITDQEPGPRHVHLHHQVAALLRDLD